MGSDVLGLPQGAGTAPRATLAPWAFLPTATAPPVAFDTLVLLSPVLPSFACQGEGGWSSWTGRVVFMDRDIPGEALKCHTSGDRAEPTQRSSGSGWVGDAFFWMPASSPTSNEDTAPVSPSVSSGCWVPPALMQVRTFSDP